MLLSSICRLILQVEANRKLEITLNGTTLMSSLKGIVNFNVNLGTIKRAITSVEFPWLTESVKGLLKSSFSLIPKIIRSKSFFRSSRKFKLKVEAKVTINII